MACDANLCCRTMGHGTGCTVLLRRSSWVVWSWRLELALVRLALLPKTRGFVIDGWRHVHFDCHVISRLAEFPAAVIYPPLSHHIIILESVNSILDVASAWLPCLTSDFFICPLNDVVSRENQEPL